MSVALRDRLGALAERDFRLLFTATTISAVPVAWAAILAAWGIGAIVGGLTALRIRPRRPLFTSYVAAFGYALPIAALGAGGPTALIAGAAFIAGVGQSVHHTLWLTVFQREVPEHAQSRVSSYGEFGSLVLNPLGMSAAGPAAAAIGIDTALWLTVVISLAMIGASAALPSVRAIRAPGHRPEPAVA